MNDRDLNNNNALILYNNPVKEKKSFLESVTNLFNNILDNIGDYYNQYGEHIKNGLNVIEYATTNDHMLDHVIDKNRYVQKKFNRTFAYKAEYTSNVIISTRDHWILRQGEGRNDHVIYKVDGIPQRELDMFYGKVHTLSFTRDGLVEKEESNEASKKHIYEFKFEREINNNKDFNRRINLDETLDYVNNFSEDKSVLNYRYYCRFTNTIIYNDYNALKHDLNNYSHHEIFEQVRDGLNGMNLKEEFFNLSDRDLYVIRNKRVVILKMASYEERKMVLYKMRNDISSTSNIVIFKNTKDKTIMGGNTHIDYVEYNDNELRKNKLYFNEGIIYTTVFSPEGNLFFQTKKEAENFLDKYGNFAKFISSKEWKNIKDNILPEEDLKRYKRGIIATLTTLTLTTAGIIASKLLDQINNNNKKEDKEVVKEVCNKAFKLSSGLSKFIKFKFNFI